MERLTKKGKPNQNQFRVDQNNAYLP